MTRSLLVGATGLLGKSLSERWDFTDSITSSSPILGGKYDVVVCAAPSAQKWLANAHPDEDLAKCNGLISRLASVQANHFIHLSTVDVYDDVSNSNEESTLTARPGYGINRLAVERAIQNQFESVLTLRLSGLVGSHLRKNPLFDLKNGHRVDMLSAQSWMQFFPIDSLVSMFESGQLMEIQGILNLTSEPIQLAEAALLIGRSLRLDLESIRYDVSSSRVDLFPTGYACSKQGSLDAIREYFGT